jgi:RecA-family ATPase
MSLAITTDTEHEGTLRYECASQDVVVRVFVQRRNGTKKCPVELLHQGDVVLATDCNLRELRDLENLHRHASTLRKGPGWHEILTAIAAELPEHVLTPWEPIVTTLSAYTVAIKEYWWYPMIPKGEPLGLAGDPGAGKSATLVKIFCHVTTGTPFPTLFPDRPEPAFPPQHVLLYTYEDDPASTILPRVVLNKGNPDLVHVVEGKRDPETKDKLPMTLQDLPLMEQLLKQFTPALIAFDPLQSFLGPDVDMNSAGDTRPVLDAVRNLCNAYGCTPLYVRHNGKTQRGKAIHAALGSIDITANARSELTLYKDPYDTQRRILAQTKTNGRWAPSMQLTLIGDTYDVVLDTGLVTIEEVRVDWDGMSDLTAEDLNARENVHGNDTDEASSALEEARAFLREMLTDGPMLIDELNTHAKKAGVSHGTLRRAKDKEHVKARRRPQDGIPGNKWPWEWYDPTRHEGQS